MENLNDQQHNSALPQSRPATTQTQNAGGLEIGDFVRLCLGNWHLFLISVFVCLCIGGYKAVSTMPRYTKTAIIQIKETGMRRTSNEVDAMLSVAGQVSSRTVNEVVVFQAPQLMSDAVSRLGLETEYQMEGRVKNTVVYGPQVPITPSFVNMPSGIPISFSVVPLEGERISVENITVPVGGKNVRCQGPYHVCYGEEIETPVGMLIVNRNPYYDSTAVWNRKLDVRRITNEAATRKFSAGLSVAQKDAKSFSDILTLSMEDYNPNRAKDLLNMIIIVYNENWVEDNNKTAVSTSLFIKDRLSYMENELNKVDEQISGYKGENLITDVRDVSTIVMNERSDIARSIREQENMLSVTRYLRSILSTGQKQLIPTPAGLNSAALITQVKEYNELLMNRDNLIANSSEKNPLVVTLDQTLTTQKNLIIASVDNEINTIERQIAYLQSVETRNAKELAKSPNQAKDLIGYERRQKVQESLYLLLLQKREENELSQAFTAYNTRLINPPFGSPVPTSPDKTKILLLAFVLGLCIPAAYLYLRMTLNTSVRGKKDLEILKAPFLGEIPRVYSVMKSRWDKYKIWEKDLGVDDPIVVKAGNRDIVNEAFRVLRTNFEFVNKVTPHSVTLVTSFNPSSGKTFVSLNLASSLVLRGKKVLLVDGDFRKASVGRHFNIKKNGFAEYLAGELSSVEEAIYQPDPNVPLFILPVGVIPPNPSELVADSKFDEAIVSLKDKYDYLLIDCAPVDIVADTQIFAHVADRTIFVVRAGLLDRSMLPELNVMYEQGIYPSLSIILNATELGEGAYSYHYGRYTRSYGRYGRYSRYGRYGHYGHYGSYPAYGEESPKKLKQA